MISECIEYLSKKLHDAMGASTRVCTTLKELKNNAESHVAAVLIESDNFTRNGSKINIMNNSGGSKAVKLFDRQLKFVVILGEYKLAALEPFFETFISSIDKGLTLSNGYYITIEPSEAEWVDKEDSILKSDIAVQLQITFHGGIYRVKEFAKLSEIITTIEEDNRDGSQ
ncbi:SON protein [Hydrogenoanaerobacterium sp.]|uniref:SON protein n=1 Tax=Hydrogenoanaerobacterium sp. TaxID=2953763 RepID=UPI00289651D9|nr:SON protein [Hydrogenoanaerobacterium sp.]